MELFITFFSCIIAVSSTTAVILAVYKIFEKFWNVNNASTWLATIVGGYAFFLVPLVILGPITNYLESLFL